MTKQTYEFTKDQLYNLLTETIKLYQEYVAMRGHNSVSGKQSAALDTIEGLDAERELFDHGELATEQLTQIYPGTVYPACMADYEQSGVDNF